MTTTVRQAAWDLAITRLIDAPRSVVFDAWTRSERAIHWWCPRDFTTPHLVMNVTPGGLWRACVRSRQGKDYWQHGVFHEVVAPRRLVFTFIWDAEPEYEMLVTVKFAERGEQTEMSFRQSPFVSFDSRESHCEGWNECFDRLEGLVDGSISLSGAREEISR